MGNPAGWAEDLHGTLVGLDSATLIYALEEHQEYAGPMREFLVGLRSGRFRAVASTVALVEVLTLPLRRGEAGRARAYEALLLDTHGLAVADLSVSVPVAREAARLRARHNLRTPDAVQLATALAGGASHFLTNDAQLRRVTELRVLVLDDLT